MKYHLRLESSNLFEYSNTFFIALMSLAKVKIFQLCFLILGFSKTIVSIVVTFILHWAYLSGAFCVCVFLKENIYEYLINNYFNLLL